MPVHQQCKCCDWGREVGFAVARVVTSFQLVGGVNDKLEGSTLFELGPQELVTTFGDWFDSRRFKLYKLVNLVLSGHETCSNCHLYPIHKLPE